MRPSKGATLDSCLSDDPSKLKTVKMTESVKLCNLKMIRQDDLLLGRTILPLFKKIIEFGLTIVQSSPY